MPITAGPARAGGTKYEWLYVYEFARPATGDRFTAILPRVRVEPMGETLAAHAHRGARSC